MSWSNPSKTELLYMRVHASPHHNLVISLRNSQITPSMTLHSRYLEVLLGPLSILLASYRITCLCFSLISLGGQSGACLDPCHLRTGLLQLASGRSASLHHPILPQRPKTFLHPAQVLLYHKAKNWPVPPYLKAFITPPQWTILPSSHQHCSTHHSSRYKKDMRQNYSLPWHTGAGINFHWLSNHLS